jgi:hypothetical protein
VTVVDKDRDPSLAIPYTVRMDVTTLSQGDIPVPDANTYQFFAFLGGVFTHSAGYQLLPFQPPDAQAIDLPAWITADDLRRAAKASQTAEGVLLSESSIPPSQVLADNPLLSSLWLRINPDDARIPITTEAAARGATWELHDVAPGSYSLATYIFSPPNNGWALRPGVVKVVDADHNAPAGVVENISETLFSYQGRRVRACLDVPAGTRLSAWFEVEERPEVGWTQWIEERDVSSGELELCFHNPNLDLTGSVRVRLELTAPDGSATTLHTPDTLTSLAGSGSCGASDTLCCDFASGAAGASGGDAGTGMAGARGRTPVDFGVTHPSDSGGCSAVRTAHAASAPGAAIAALSALLYALGMRVRFSRRARARRLRSKSGSARLEAPRCGWCPAAAWACRTKGFRRRTDSSIQARSTSSRDRA